MDIINTGRAAALAMLLATGVAVSACNTVEGAGADIEGAGEAIQDTAKDAKKELKD